MRPISAFFITLFLLNYSARGPVEAGDQSARCPAHEVWPGDNLILTYMTQYFNAGPGKEPLSAPRKQGGNHFRCKAEGIMLTLTLVYGKQALAGIKEDIYMKTINEQIAALGVVPVIALHNADNAAPLAEALSKGGLPVAEVTFRTQAAEASIRAIATKHPDVLVGAGTVLTFEQVKRALDAGAKFIVTPGFSRKIVEFCVAVKVPVFPGCVTPTEVTEALEYNLEVLKFFPAEQCGGLDRIKALAAPFPMVKFMPTGGVGLKNLAEYISCKAVAACGGTYMVKAELIDNHRWDEISALCAQSIEIVKAARNG
jgi:2-dehydro-3-deoxyphosphogluconate aldolase/(4S)-4-hydroxy-2-oxoglutarate aldolase